MRPPSLPADYNACETWGTGNRHFTFLVYLNEVEGEGGETTVRTARYSPLLCRYDTEGGQTTVRTRPSSHAHTRPSRSFGRPAICG